MAMPRKYPRGYYHYLLCYPDGTPFYVGSGKGDRFGGSLKLPLLADVIAGIASTGKNPLVIVVEAENKEVARIEEERLISKYGRLDQSTGILLNRTDGPGSRGRILSESALAGMRAKRSPLSEDRKMQIAQSMRGNTHLLGHVHSEESRARISQAGKGRKLELSPEERQKRSERIRARNLTSQNPAGGHRRCE